jgi:hypothetical protein
MSNIQNFIPSIEDLKSIGLVLSEESELEGFDLLSFAHVNFDMAIYQKQFEPAKGTVEYVLQDHNKGIVFIGYVESFEQLKDQIKRCRLKID